MTYHWLGRPHDPMTQYPWRPLDNRERRAAWALKYYQQHKPHQHEQRQEVRHAS